MKREEYMNQLRERLEKFGQELQKEILDDYSQHFAEGQAAGRTDEEIIQELGDIEDMIRELRAVETEQAGEETAAVAEESRIQSEADPTAYKEEKSQHTPDGGIYFGNFAGAVFKTGVADIMLTQSEDDAVHVEYRHGDSEENLQKYEYYQYEKDGVFCAGIRKNRNYNDGTQRSFNIGPTTITFNNNFFSKDGARNRDLALIIKMPKKIPEAKLETSSGDISVRDLALEKIKCVTASGDMEIRGSMLKRAETSSSSGDVKLANNTVERGESVTASGDVEVLGSVLTGMKITSASGDIKFVDDTVEELKITSASGDVTIRNTGSRTVEASTASGDLDLCLEKTERVKLSTASGDAAVKFKDMEDAEVKVNSRSGEIDINHRGSKMQVQSGVTYKFGEGTCKVSVNTGSGDVCVEL